MNCDLRGPQEILQEQVPLQFPVDILRQNRRANITSNSLEGISSSYLQEVRNEYYDQKEKAPAFSQMEEKDNWIYWTVWIQWIWWPGTSDPQQYKALADTRTQCTLKPLRYVGEESMCIFEWRGIPTADCAGIWSEPDWEWVAKPPHCDWSRGPMYPWHRYLRAGYFTDPKRALLGFWDSCSTDRGN